jgi:hypothetical protein
VPNKRSRTAVSAGGGDGGGEQAPALSSTLTVQQQNRAAQDQQMGELLRRAPMRAVSMEPHAVVSTAAFYVFATALERALHAAMWDKVRRLSSWEEARDRAREAQLVFLEKLSQQQPGAAELLRHVVRLADEAIAANGAEEEGAAAVEIRLLDRVVPAPPIPSSDGSASASGSGGSPISFSSRDGPAPARLPPVRSLRMVVEGGGSGEASLLLLLPPLSLAPALDVPRPPEMAHDCYFNFLRHVLALVSGHPFFR